MCYFQLLADAGIPRQYGLIGLASMLSLVLVNTYTLLPAYKINIDTSPMTPTSETHGVGDGSSPKEPRGEKSRLLAKGFKKYDTPNLPPSSPPHSPTDQPDSFTAVMTSSFMLLHVFWFSMHHLRIQYYIGSFLLWTTHVLDNNKEQGDKTQ